MRQIHFLYIAPGLPSDLISNTLSNKLNYTMLSIGKMLRQQFDRNDDLTFRMRGYIDLGKVVAPSLTTELIFLNIKELGYPNILLLGYPRTLEEYQEISKILLDNNYVIGKFWYFEHKDSSEYFQKYYEDPMHKPYLDKYGDEMEQSWFRTIDNYSHDMKELNLLTNRLVWNKIKVGFTDKMQGLTRFQAIIDEYSDLI